MYNYFLSIQSSYNKIFFKKNLFCSLLFFFKKKWKLHKIKMKDRKQLYNYSSAYLSSLFSRTL